MLYSLAARALLMVAEGTTWTEAVLWVIRPMPKNLHRFYAKHVGYLVRRELPYTCSIPDYFSL